MKFVRWLLGRMILTVDFLTRPKPIVRAQHEQDALDVLTAKMSLYQFKACPFCVLVRRDLRKHTLDIELRDAKKDGVHKKDLIQYGGKHKVPCLRLEDGSENGKWLYESKAIRAFLKIEFGLS